MRKELALLQGRGGESLLLISLISLCPSSATTLAMLVRLLIVAVHADCPGAVCGLVGVKGHFWSYQKERFIILKLRKFLMILLNEFFSIRLFKKPLRRLKYSLFRLQNSLRLMRHYFLKDYRVFLVRRFLLP